MFDVPNVRMEMQSHTQNMKILKLTNMKIEMKLLIYLIAFKTFVSYPQTNKI